MAEDCIFCKIAKGEMEADKVYEDELAVAFKDINPQAPTHVLIIPREHIPTLNDLEEGQEGMAGHLFTVAKKLARDLGIAEAGYRCVVNTNRGAGQAVYHIHLHLLGGRQMSWPPG